MDYTMICPVCTTPCVDRYEDKCSGCGSSSDPIFVYTPLIKVVKLLIKRGIGVIDTDIKYCTSHKTKVIIQLAGNIPIGLFSDLPCGWQINNFNQLRCSEIDSSNMISNLEDWAMDKDPDVFKALLRLSGYDTGI